ncbi:MAG: non-homologous end-joining DNA ligase [Gemmatimonadota bacterium]
MTQAAFPDWVEPMAATLTQERFSGPEWLFEQKFDGIRLLAFRKGKSVRLLSRNRLEQRHPAITEALLALPLRDAILDGEAMGVWGKAARFGYHIFDVIHLDGRDLTSLPLMVRRALLDSFALEPPLYRVRELAGARPWEKACAEGWEGVIAKRRDAPYEHKRSKHWLKMKCEASQELVVGGFTEPQGARKGLGALLVGYFEGRQFVFAGKVGTGFDTAMLLNLRPRLDRIEIGISPFDVATGLPRIRTHWVRPEVVVQVAFTEWTVHGKLRHPRLIAIRDDKRADQVARESE